MTLDTRSFDLNRALPIAPEQLWNIMTDPTHREKWGAPEENMVLTVEKSDLKVGGQDRHRCGPAEAPEFVVETRWYDLTAPTRAVFTETLLIQDNTLCTSLVTYSLVASDEGTQLGVTVAVSSFSGPETLDEFLEGWSGGLDNLERYTSQMNKTPKP